MSERRHFIELAQEAGFDQEQAEFLWEHLAKFPHTHTADQIEDLDEAVEEIIDAAGE